MKRTFTFFIILALFFSLIRSTAYATSDKAFTTTRLNKFGSVAIVLGNKFGFDIGGFIIPFFTEDGNMATPDFFPGADFKGEISKYTTPQSKIDLSKLIEWNEAANPVILTALYGAILKTDAEHSNHPEPPDCYISEELETSAPIENAPRHFWTGQFLNAMYGIRPIVPPDSSGVIDFNRGQRPLAGMNPAEDCKKHAIGFEREKLENDLKKLSHFGEGTSIYGQEMTTIMKIVEFFNKLTGQTETREEPETEPHKDDVILTKDQKLPWFNFMCNDYWCPGNETSDDSSNTDKTGGWTNFLLPPKDQLKVLAASVQPYEIRVLGFPQKPLLASYDAFNQSQVGMQKAGCYATPYTPENNPQADAALGGLVKIQDQCEVAPPMACEEKWFKELNVEHSPGSSGAHGDPGYSIPYRSASCTIDDSMLQTFIDTAQWWCSASACDYGAMSANLTAETLGQVKDYAKKYGWNAMFMMALWIHESALGSHNNATHHLGCTYGWPAQGNTAIHMPEIGDPQDGICSQMACLFSFPHDDPSDFAGFMCSYNTTAITNGSCPNGEAWTFATEVHDIYAKLLACTNTPPGCGFSSDSTGRTFTCGSTAGE